MPLDLAADIGDGASAKDWVRRSRVIELGSKEEAKRLAELKQKQLDEEEDEMMMQQQQNLYGASDLRGLKVMHGADDFEAGESVVLTLADHSILQTDEEGKLLGLNDEDDDVLENVNLADDDRRKAREAQLKRLRKPVYSALDDYEFEDGVATGTRAPLLPQYEKEKKTAPKLELGEGGSLILEQLSANVAKAASSSNTVHKVSLKADGGSIFSKDYYTAAELEEQRKGTKFKSRKGEKKSKKHRQLRKKDHGDENEDAMEQDDPTANQQPMIPNGNSSSSSSKVIVTAINPAPAIKFQSIDLDEDDPELAQALARARRLALQRQQQQMSMDVTDAQVPDIGTRDRGARIAKSLADQTITSAATTNNSRSTAAAESKGDENDYQNKSANLSAIFEGYEAVDDDLTDDLDTQGRRKDGTLVFNSTTEFSTRLQARLNDKARLKTEALVRELEQRSNAVLNNPLAAAGTAVVDDESIETAEDETGLDVQDNGDGDEPAVDAGAANQDYELNNGDDAIKVSKKRSRWDSDVQTKASDAADSAAVAAAHQKRSRWDSVDVGAEAEATGAADEDSDDNDDNAPAFKRRHINKATAAEDADNDRDVMLMLAEEERNAAELEAAMNSGSDDDEELDDEQLAFLHRQPLVAKGMGATLALLKASGDLKQSEELAGRAKDSRSIDPSKNDFGVKLEYRDEYGRKLTQKEAFRQLSYRFHGYGPSKKKLEKRLKQLEIQNQATSSRAGILEGSGGTMKSLTQAQAATGKAHITVQGGQPSATIPPAKLVAQAMLAKQQKQQAKQNTKNANKPHK